MSSTTPTPVSGGDGDEGAPDGVNDPGGRGAGGESAGGNYRAQPDEDGERPSIGYHGVDAAGAETPNSPNAMVQDGGDWAATGKTGPKPGPTGPDQDLDAEYPREVTVGDQRIEVIDTSGIAAAEAAGTTGAEGQRAKTDEHPGSG